MTERICSYLGRSRIRFGFLKVEKSAEVIVVDGKRAVKEIQTDSQDNEGLNVWKIEIYLGSPNFEFASPLIK